MQLLETLIVLIFKYTNFTQKNLLAKQKYMREPILGYVPKNDEKNSGGKGLT